MTMILAACPAYGGNVTLPFHRSFVAMMTECQQTNVQLASMITHSGFVSRARNIGAAFVMQKDNFTHLLTIDADMGWPVGALTRLIGADKDIVGCTYPRRALLPNPSFIGGIDRKSPEFKIEEGFCRAIYVGCGFTLIKREALIRMAHFYPERQGIDETVKGPVWDLFPSGMDPITKTTITDDVGFCRLATAAGLDVWADVALPLTHTGQVTFDLGPLGNFLADPKFAVDIGEPKE